MSYTLLTPTLPTGLAAWQVQYIQGEQQTTDISYLNSLQQFDQAASNWLLGNQVGRDNSPDPVHFTPTLFATPIPLRTVFNGTGANDYTLRDDLVSPRPQAPKMPDYVPPASPEQPSTSAPSDEAADAAFKVMVVSLLQDIRSRLTRAGF